MTPRRLTALLALTAAAAGGITAVAVTAGDDHDTRTVTVVDATSTDTSVGAALDDLIAKGDRLSFDVAERNGSGRASRVRAHVERDAAGRITGRLDARP